MNYFKKICRLAAHLVMVTTLTHTVGPAFAQTAPPSDVDLMLRGDIRITKNATGTVLANIPAGQTAEEMYSMSGNSPIIWGRYYEANKSGTIMVSYLTRNVNDPSCTPTTPHTCGVTISTTPLTPEMGNRFAEGNGVKKLFDGVNPFEAFIDPVGSPIYKNIHFGAFQAVMGMWAKNYSSSRGYLAVAETKFGGVFNWDECRKKVFGACVKKRFHNEANTKVKAKWYVMTTPERAQGRGALTSYRARGCISSDLSCTVLGGMAFLEVSKHSDFPSEEEQSWHQHKWDDSWTVMAFILVIAAVVSGGMLLFAAGPVFFSTALVGASTGLGGFVAIAVVEGIGFGLAYGAISYVANGGQGSFGDAQDGLFGNLSDGSISATPDSNPEWSPAQCMQYGSGPHASAGGRYGNQECRSWLTSDLSAAPSGVGSFFNDRNVEPTRDWSITNDVKALRSSGGTPLREGGLPSRQ